MIITEYLSLGSLQHFLVTPRGQSLSAIDTIRITRGIAAGMMHLSSENVVHRDLAARNVLLTSDLVPKISIFFHLLENLRTRRFWNESICDASRYRKYY
jgi:serine/threonine protein kinase